MNTLVDKIKESLKCDNPRANEIITDMERTRLNFCPGLSLNDIWEQDKSSYIETGMNSFDAGYCSSAKKQ